LEIQWGRFCKQVGAFRWLFPGNYTTQDFVGFNPSLFWSFLDLVLLKKQMTSGIPKDFRKFLGNPIEL